MKPKGEAIKRLFVWLVILVLTFLLADNPPKHSSANPVNKQEVHKVEFPPAEIPVQPQKAEAVEPPKQPESWPKGCENYVAIYQKHFGSKAATFLRIARAESGCNPMAVGDKHLTYVQNGITYGMSCGMLQVRFLPGRPTCAEMHNPEANAMYAAKLYASGGFRHWTVCNKGIVNCY